jgi:hypothetical protein
VARILMFSSGRRRLDRVGWYYELVRLARMKDEPTTISADHFARHGEAEMPVLKPVADLSDDPS